MHPIVFGLLNDIASLVWLAMSAYVVGRFGRAGWIVGEYRTLDYLQKKGESRGTK